VKLHEPSFINAKVVGAALDTDQQFTNKRHQHTKSNNDKMQFKHPSDNNNDEVYYDKEMDDTPYDIIKNYKDEEKKIEEANIKRFYHFYLLDKDFRD
jgi:hypothetical protein